MQITLESPAAEGELRVFNQFTQMFSVNDLATLVVNAAVTIGRDVEIRNLPNPRIEAEDHYYNPAYSGLFELGLEPHFLDESAIIELLEMVTRHEDSIRQDIIFRGVKWR